MAKLAILHLTVAAIEEWLRTNFPGETKVTATLGLCEEVGEVARAVLKQDQGIRGTYEEWQEEIAKELGDVFVKLVHVADLCAIDLIPAILDRWKEVNKRDWTTNKRGHGLPSDPGLGGAQLKGR